MLKGIRISRGVALGRLYLYVPFVPQVEQGPCMPGGEEAQRKAYLRAKKASAKELCDLAEALQAHGSAQSGIFQAHLEILDDVVMEEEILDAITQERATAGEAVDRVYRVYAKAVARAGEPVIRERARDLDDVRGRILRNLQGVPEKNLAGLTQPCIVAAEELLPSQIAQMNPAVVQGLAAQKGSATCHAAIVAQSLGLPAVFGIEGLMEQAQDGVRAVLDGEEGTLVLAPDDETWAHYERQALRARRLAKQAAAYMERPAVTLDGCRVDICLNLGDGVLPPELAQSDGVGLLRTEFLFMQKEHLPTEEEQFTAYRQVLEGARGKPVTLRTLDIGGDKQLPYLPLPREENPFLGVRAVRLCFARPQIFRTQLRAALRASVYGQLWLMFPMVGSLDDWRRAREAFLDVKEELTASGVPVAGSIRLGVMIEVPSAALLARQLAAEVDFASVGTNDLCQYLFAADRTNKDVAPYAQKYAPVLLELLGNVAAAFNAAGKPLSICGELGGDALAAAALVGLGYRKLSMPPVHMGYVKQVICTGRCADMQKLARSLLERQTQSEAEALLNRYYELAVR